MHQYKKKTYKCNRTLTVTLSRYSKDSVHLAGHLAPSCLSCLSTGLIDITPDIFSGEPQPSSAGHKRRHALQRGRSQTFHVRAGRESLQKFGTEFRRHPSVEQQTIGGLGVEEAFILCSSSPQSGESHPAVLIGRTLGEQR